MSAVATDLCPSWCVEHHLGDGGSDDHFGPRAETALGEFRVQMHVDLDADTVEQVIYLGDDNLTPAQARELATAVLRLANTLDPRPVPAGLETCAVPMAAEMLGLEFSQALAVAEASYGIGAHR